MHRASLLRLVFRELFAFENRLPPCPTHPTWREKIANVWR